MVDHWDRPGWSANREAYYWYLTFDQPDLVQLAAACQDQLRLPYLDPVPLNALHLTLPRVGWTDQITEEQVDRVVETAKNQCADLSEFRLTIGPLSGSPGAVRFSVSPWDPVLALYERLRSSVTAALSEEYLEPAFEFRPHIGIAYCNTPIPPMYLVSAVSKLRVLPPISVMVKQVELVRLRRENKSYLWSTVEAIALG
ncbi:2'-5' RNA ligase family protein [Actinoplanes sp. NPDC000266]